MGCFSCLPKEKRQSMDGSTSTQAKKRRISCFSCFPGQDSTEAKRRNVNCFSCFSAEDSTEGKKRNMNCFPCFRVQDMTRAKKDLTQDKKDSTHGKTRKADCFSCFRTQDSTQPKKDATQGKAPKMHSTHEKTANTNCFLGFTTQVKSWSTQGKKRKMNFFSYYRTQEKKDSTQGKTRIRVRSYFSSYPKQGKIRKMRLRRIVKCPRLPFKNKHRVPDQIQYEDVKKCKFNIKDQANNNLAVKNFTFKELATATKNFREECLLGEGGFGRVYKGKLKKTGEDVAVKQLNREGKQGNSEFIVEVMMLSHLCHPHLVNLVGYCADGDQRLLVYEYMSAGSLENHLLDLEPGKKSLDWSTRIKVALHAAKGLEYMHETNKPPIIYRDLKSSNILLDKDFNAKLSDFGLAKLGPVGEKTHVTSRVMGTLGYCAPEYQKTGKLTVKSDLYSYGVVLLELITGRRAVDFSRESEELHLVRWVEPMIKHPHRYSELVDPMLEGNYPRADLSQVLAIASMCLNVDASVRPSTSDVVAALGSLVDDPVP